MDRKIHLFGHVWHLGHQYELCKIPGVEWFWLINPRRTFSSMPRGPIENYGAKYVSYYEKGKYDVALLHLDQQCLEDELWERGKGSLFKDLNEYITDIPKIVIMHGTPYYPEAFECDITKNNYEEWGYSKDQIGMSSDLINRLQTAIKDIDFIIFNSEKAMKQWGFVESERAKTIWHGMDVNEWWDLPKEPRVITMISPAGLDRYYDRKFLSSVREELEERDIYHCHISYDVKFDNWDEYRDFIGRSLIYFNPTRESPMPRARTEAMLSGACIITTLNQDAEKYIEDGVNGYRAIRNPKFVANLIEGLIDNYESAIEVGQNGKKTAQELFNGERFREDWEEVLDFVLSNKS